MRLNLRLFASSVVLTLPLVSSLPLANLKTGNSAFKHNNPRSVQTCADPSLARIVHQGYSSQLTSHVIHFRHAFISVNTAQGPAESVFWSLQGEQFRAWPTQQPFTVPLFRLAAGGGNDYVFMTGPDAQTPPILSGFRPDGDAIVAWVYDTPVCGSVPLMSAVFATQTDHYYTTDPDEHAGLLSDGIGWSDSGVVAFVLPLSSS